MQIMLDKELIEIENNESGLEKLLQIIEQKAMASELIFSHLVIDGVEIYEDFANYLQANFQNIKDIHLEFLPLQQFLQDILQSTGQYLDGVIATIDNLASAIYNQVDSETWQQIDMLLEGIQWLGETFRVMDSLPNLADMVKDYEQWNLYAKDLQELEVATASLSEPLQFADHVTVGDIILYEIKPVMERLIDSLPSLK